MIFEPPNLDACNQPDELNEIVTVLGLLENYCRNKQIAMAFRLGGNIQYASMYEKRMQRLYEKLPQWAKW